MKPEDTVFKHRDAAFEHVCNAHDLLLDYTIVDDTDLKQDLLDTRYELRKALKEVTRALRAQKIAKRLETNECPNCIHDASFKMLDPRKGFCKCGYKGCPCTKHQ